MFQNNNIDFPLTDVRKTATEAFDPTHFTGGSIENITVPTVADSDGYYSYQLSEIPLKANAVSGNSDVIISGLTRVNTTLPENNEFYVNYRRGILIFNLNQSSDNYDVDYWGIGDIIKTSEVNYLYDIIDRTEVRNTTILDTNIGNFREFVDVDLNNPNLISDINDGWCWDFKTALHTNGTSSYFGESSTVSEGLDQIIIRIYIDEEITSASPGNIIGGFRDIITSLINLGAASGALLDETLSFWNTGTGDTVFIKDNIQPGFREIKLLWNVETLLYEIYIDGDKKTTYSNTMSYVTDHRILIGKRGSSTQYGSVNVQYVQVNDNIVQENRTVNGVDFNSEEKSSYIDSNSLNYITESGQYFKKLYKVNLENSPGTDYEPLFCDGGNSGSDMAVCVSIGQDSIDDLHVYISGDGSTQQGGSTSILIRNQGLKEFYVEFDGTDADPNNRLRIIDGVTENVLYTFTGITITSIYNNGGLVEIGRDVDGVLDNLIGCVGDVISFNRSGDIIDRIVSIPQSDGIVHSIYTDTQYTISEDTLFTFHKQDSDFFSITEPNDTYLYKFGSNIIGDAIVPESQLNIGFDTYNNAIVDNIREYRYGITNNVSNLTSNVGVIRIKMFIPENNDKLSYPFGFASDTSSNTNIFMQTDWRNATDDDITFYYEIDNIVHWEIKTTGNILQTYEGQFVTIDLIQDRVALKIEINETTIPYSFIQQDNPRKWLNDAIIATTPITNITIGANITNSTIFSSEDIIYEFTVFNTIDTSYKSNVAFSIVIDEGRNNILIDRSVNSNDFIIQDEKIEYFWDYKEIPNELIQQFKVVKLHGEYEELPIIKVIDNLNDIPFGFTENYISGDVNIKILNSGRVEVTGFDTTTSEKDDKVFCDSLGNLTLTETPIYVGRVLTTETNGVVYINITPTNLYKDLEIDTIQYNPALPSVPSYSEGLNYYDPITKTMAFYNDINKPNFSLQSGSVWGKLINKTGDVIPAGTPIYVADIDLVSGFFKMDLAESDSYTASTVVGMTGHEVGIDELGIIVRVGIIPNVDTSGVNVGDVLYLSTTPGEFTNTRPGFPSSSTILGRAIDSDVNGSIYCIIIDDQYDYEFDGCAIERQDIFVVNDTGNTYLDVELIGGGDVPVQLDGNIYLLDCTTGTGVGGRARVQLTPGTATSPTFNLIWVQLTGGIPTLTTGIAPPVGIPYTYIAYITLLDDTFTSTNGPLTTQRSTDAKAHDGRGRIAYIDERIRLEGPKWFSGVEPDATITTNVGSLDNLNFDVTTGIVFQLHRQLFPTLDVSIDGAYIINVNGSGTLQNFQKITDLNEVDEDVSGNSLSGSRYNLTIFGSICKETNECKIFVSPPNNSYGNDTDAYYDTEQTAITSVERDLTFTTFLIARIPVRHRTLSGGTITFINPGGLPEFIDLRGNIIGQSGSSSGGFTTRFSDNNFAIFNDLDDTAEIRFVADQITTATVRSLTVQDKDGTIALLDDTINYATHSEPAITGVLTGGGLSQTSGTQVQIIAGVGRIVDFYTNYASGNITPVAWSTQTIVIPNLGTDTYTYIYVDNTGTIQTKNSSLTTLEDRENILLGFTINNINISSIYDVIESPKVIGNTSQTYSDQFNFMGGIINGGTVYQTLDTGTNGTLALHINQLDAFFPNINWQTSKSNSNIKSFAAVDPAVWSYALQTGEITFSSVISITPNLYDNGGTLTAVPTTGGGRIATIQYIYKLISGDHITLYGQIVYDDISDAYLKLDKDFNDLILPDYLKKYAEPLAAIIVSQNCTDLNDETTAHIKQLSNNVGSGGPVMVSQLDSPDGTILGIVSVDNSGDTLITSVNTTIESATQAILNISSATGGTISTDTCYIEFKKNFSVPRGIIGVPGFNGFSPENTGMTHTTALSLVVQSKTNLYLGVQSEAVIELLNVVSNVDDSKAKIYGTDTNDVLRLWGTGSFGSGAKLNFGDSDYVWMGETADDIFIMHGALGVQFSTSENYGGDLSFGSTDDFYGAGTYTSDIFVDVTNHYVGLGANNTTPTQTLDVSGNGRFRTIGSGTVAANLSVTSDGTLTTATSDERKKTNIKPLEIDIEDINKLNPVMFNWIENNKEDIGFIAQEVEKIYPHIVFTNPSDLFKGINYTLFTPIIIKYIQDLKKRIEKVENKG